MRQEGSLTLIALFLFVFFSFFYVRNVVSACGYFETPKYNNGGHLLV